MNNPVDRAETALRAWKADADKGIQRVIVNPRVHGETALVA